MMNIRIDERHAYVEIEVYGAYQLDRLPEVLDAMQGLSERHGRFSMLEIHFGKPQNLLKAMSKMSNATGTSENYSFVKNLRKYALVTDEPGILFRLIAAFSQGGSVSMRIFPAHERDHARQWVESDDAQSGVREGAASYRIDP